MSLQTLEAIFNRRLVDHESGHAAAALAQGLDVFRVSAPYWRIEDAAACGPDDTAGYALIQRPHENDHDRTRKFAIAITVGALEDKSRGWPPRWPLNEAPTNPDERDFCELVKRLGLVT